MALKYVTGNARVDWVISMIESFGWYELEKLKKHLPEGLDSDAYRRGWDDGKEYADAEHAAKRLA